MLSSGGAAESGRGTASPPGAWAERRPRARRYRVQLELSRGARLHQLALFMPHLIRLGAPPAAGAWRDLRVLHLDQYSSGPWQPLSAAEPASAAAAARAEHSGGGGGEEIAKFWQFTLLCLMGTLIMVVMHYTFSSTTPRVPHRSPPPAASAAAAAARPPPYSEPSKLTVDLHQQRREEPPPYITCYITNETGPAYHPRNADNEEATDADDGGVAERCVRSDYSHAEDTANGSGLAGALEAESELVSSDDRIRLILA